MARSSSSSSPKIKAAVLDRPRRSTAGLRLSSLVGKAQEEDETFWSHSIWNEKGGGFASSDGTRRGSSSSKKRRRRNDDDDDDGSENSSSSEDDEETEGEGNDGNANEEVESSDDDGEGSYRMSDDDTSMAEDQFDSDFDESESDEDDNNIVGEDGEVIMGMGEEEYELLAEEKRNAANMKRKKNQRLFATTTTSSILSLAPTKSLPSSAAAATAAKKKKGGGASSKTGKKGVSSSSKRGPMGTGWNEGLVLNWNVQQYPLPSPQLPTTTASALSVGAAVSLPPASASTLSQLSELQSTSIPPDAAATTTITQPISEPLSLPLPDDATQIIVGGIAQPHLPIHNLRTTSSSSAAAAAIAPPTSVPSVKPPSPTKAQKQQRLINKQQLKQQSISERKQSQRRQFTQEELIVEAIQCTETANAKWLHARQRSKEEAATIENSKTNTGGASSSKYSNSNRKLISRFYSRRGCNNTLTFMDMDHLPECLVRGGRQGHHDHDHRRPRTTSFSSSFGNPTITSPSSRLSASDKSLEAREATQQQTSSTSPSSATSSTPPTTSNNNTTPERPFEKCIITGKMAKYRDPKSMLGYHDIEAYKELKRKLESGEIVVPENIHHRVPTSSSSTNGRNKVGQVSNSSANGKGGKGTTTTISISTTSRKRGGAKGATTTAPVSTTNYFPFAEDQPTMIAQIASSSASFLGIDSVKVIVTQQGIPVSPPSSPLQPPSRISAEQPSIFEDDRKQPPESMLATGRNGNAISANNVTSTTAPMNEVQASTTTGSTQPMISSTNPIVDQTNTSGTVTNDAENGNNIHGAERAKSLVPVVNGSGSAVDATIPTAGVAVVVAENGGGSMERRIMAPTSSTLPAPRISNSTKSSDGAAVEKVIVPDVTTSNDKRTTIEAN